MSSSSLGRLAILLVIISMTVSTPSAQPSSVNWAKRVDSGNGPETITNLQFYFHDILSGKNPTAMQIIKPVATTTAANSNSNSNSFFGAVTMADDPLTETADEGSKVVGRAQGLYAFASRNDFTLLMSMSYGFIDGPYNGSSLSIMGGNPAMNTNREMPVLGGTGVFRMARGYALMKTVSLNGAGDAVVHYNVTVHAPSSNANIEQVSPASGGGGGTTRAATKTLSSSSSSPVIMSGKPWMTGAVIGFAAFICFTL